MKTAAVRLLVFFALTTMFITACAVQSTPPPPFEAQPIAAGKYQQKADHLYFILDASSSMADGYGGQVKMEIARAVIQNFNQTMPELNITVYMRTFGHDDRVSAKTSVLMVEPKPYSAGLLPDGLKKVRRAGGISPLDRALKDALIDLNDVKDSIAMVIVSDGKDMDRAPINAAQAIKAAHGSRICIFTVLVGDDAAGRMLLSRVAGVTGCGAAVAADGLAAGAEMNAFVREVLLGGLMVKDSDGDGVPDDKDQCPDTLRGVKVDGRGCPLDSDKDGVPDYKDQCPGTPIGIKVDDKGCPIPSAAISAAETAAGTYIFKDIQFEVNKADLKKSAYPTLDEIAGALKSRPDLKIEIQGHTDSTGDHAYNLDLSQKRAEAVKAYLVSKGVEGSRILPKGYGPDQPIDTNATKAGRANNRRVEFKPIREWHLEMPDREQ